MLEYSHDAKIVTIHEHSYQNREERTNTTNDENGCNENTKLKLFCIFMTLYVIPLNMGAIGLSLNNYEVFIVFYVFSNVSMIMSLLTLPNILKRFLTELCCLRNHSLTILFTVCALGYLTCLFLVLTNHKNVIVSVISVLIQQVIYILFVLGSSPVHGAVQSCVSSLDKS